MEADEKTQRLLEDFGQENAPIRVGWRLTPPPKCPNLHFQSHRLIHSALPLPPLRFQQSTSIRVLMARTAHATISWARAVTRRFASTAAARRTRGEGRRFSDRASVILRLPWRGRRRTRGRKSSPRRCPLEWSRGVWRGDGGARSSRRPCPFRGRTPCLFGDYAGSDHSATASTSPTASGTPPRCYTFSYARPRVQRLADPKGGFSLLSLRYLTRRID